MAHDHHSGQRAGCRGRDCGAVWGLTRGGGHQAPLIEADARPIKVRPDNPGGLRVPNQDVVIFEGAGRTRPAERSGLAPEVENPRVDQLRSFITR